MSAYPRHESVDVCIPKTPQQKRDWKITQGNEYTRINNYSEGRCYFCEKNTYVSPRFVKVCLNGCFHRYNKRCIIGPPKQVYMDGWCYGCHQHVQFTGRWNIVELNVRVCHRCERRFHGARRTSLNPSIRVLERTLGKDWETESGLIGMVDS